MIKHEQDVALKENYEGMNYSHKLNYQIILCKRLTMR